MNGNELGFLMRFIMALGKIVKVIFKVLFFFGFGWFLLPIGLGLAIEIITGTPFTEINPVLFFLIDKVLWYAAFPLAFLTGTQNIVRMVKKDRSFSWLGLLQGREKKGIVSKADGKMVEMVSGDKVHGFVFGKENGKYIVKPETTDGHILVIGSPGCGKSASIAIPTLMSWKARAFVIDIKGELYEKAGKARGLENIKVFNPNDPHACGYDPFYMLKNTDDVASEARQIAISICPLPPDTKDPFWIKSAQNLFTGLIIYYFEQKYSFSETMLEIKSTPIARQILEILEDEEASKVVKAHLSEFSGMDDKTLSGVFAELSNHITVFATNSNLQRALSGGGNCITPNDLENGKDIFCCVQGDKLDEWADLLGMMCNQFLKFCERREEENNKPILFLIDEFPNVGKIETITKGLATLRSKNIHIALIIQSKSQLNAVYGKDIAEVIADNCTYKAILKANEANTQEWCSRLVGTYDKRKVSSSYNADMLGVGKGQGTNTGTEEKRIIKPEEFSSLQDVVCLFPNGYKRIERAYYKDKTFLEKVQK